MMHRVFIVISNVGISLVGVHGLVTGFGYIQCNPCTFWKCVSVWERNDQWPLLCSAMLFTLYNGTQQLGMVMCVKAHTCPHPTGKVSVTDLRLSMCKD